MTLSASFLGAILTVTMVGSSVAVTVHVSPDGTGDFPNIQAAIFVCADGDTIELADGTYTGAGNRDMSYLGKAITIRSLNGRDNCVIDCEGAPGDFHRAFNFYDQEGQNSTLEDVTIVNGYLGSNSSGGAIGIGADASPAFIRCIFRDNFGGVGNGHGGGAIAGNNCAPTFIDCLFENNRHNTTGGAAAFALNANPEFRNCQFIGNDGGIYGQAIILWDNSGGVIENCTFIDNGVNHLNQFTIHHAVDSAYLRLTRCIFAGNSKVIGSDGEVLVEECTLAFNEAGLYTEAQMTVRNTIIAYNNTYGIALNFDPILTINCTDMFGNESDWVGDLLPYLTDTALGNFWANPLFCDPFGREDQFEDLALGDNSPCLPGQHPNQIDCGGVIGAVGSCGRVDVSEAVVGGHLFRVAPNPFHRSVRLSLAGTTASEQVLSIYDGSGRQIWKGALPGDQTSFTWDAVDDRGRPVSPGVYFLRLRSGADVQTRKVLFVR